MLKCISSTPVRTVKPTVLPKYVRVLSEHPRPNGDGDGMPFLNTLRPSSYMACQGKSVAWIHKRKILSHLLGLCSLYIALKMHCMVHEVDTLNISSLICLLTRVKSGHVDVFIMRRPVCMCRHVRRTLSVEVACVVQSACGSGTCECASQWVRWEKTVIQWATRFIFSLSSSRLLWFLYVFFFFFKSLIST